MKYQTISLFAAKGAIYYVTIATVIFSHVEILCFHGKAHLVFHWCLYNKIEIIYIIINNNNNKNNNVIIIIIML